MKWLPSFTFLIAILLSPSQSFAQQPPSFSKDIRPFFAKYCIECHNPKALKGGLNLQSYKDLRKGGDKGSVLTPGEPDKSLLVLLTEEKKSPRMPPRKIKRRPTKTEVAMLRRWVETGAKDDTGKVVVAIPNIVPKQPTASPITALAYHPKGKWLAVAKYNTVDLLDSSGKKTKSDWITTPEPITALAYNRQGTRLAVAFGRPGMHGEIRVFPINSDGELSGKPIAIPQAHDDVILQTRFHPNGETLATCSYDTRVKLWNAADGKLVSTLKEHSDSVYGVAFHSSGDLLATVAADRAVKVWRTDSAQLLYTMGENTDWVYAVAWSPNGNFLAAGGVDKSIRIWRADQDGKQLLHSVFAHQEPVTRLVFSPDSNTLYSVSEDHTIKAWDVKRMTERNVYPAQPEEILAFAVRPDHRQLAVGRYDGTTILLEPAGKVTATIEQKPEPPEISSATPKWAPRGKTISITFVGKHLLHVNKIVPSDSEIKAVIAERKPSSIQAEVTLPSQISAGDYQFRLENAVGKSKPVAFTVDYFESHPESESNDSPGSGQKITLSASIAGKLDRTGDVDYYRFHAKAGTQVGVQILPQMKKGKAAFEPFLQLIAQNGQVLAQSSSDVLGHSVEKTGEYALGVRDRDLQASGVTYRLHIGEVPVVTSVFPLGVQQGEKQQIQIEGVHLGDAKTVWVEAIRSSVGAKLPVNLTSPLGTPLGRRQIIVGEFPEVNQTPPAQSRDLSGTIPVPGTANGRLQEPGQTDLWQFDAKKGQTLIVEVNARRLGSQLDSMIEILDHNNQPVPRATLRSLAKTYVTFRDHDSRNPRIRIESWDELAVNDFIWIGNELIKIEALPTHPDSDCVFFSEAGQRTGFLDTTPTFHTKGEPMYKVAIHPPGTDFPPNGFPTVTVYYRNDDGGPGYGRDSRLYFTAPEDGQYRIRIKDSRGEGGANYGYRLTVRRPQPSFDISFSPTNPKVYRGGAIPLTINAKRIDGYNGKIAVRIKGLPDGFSAPPTEILPDQNDTSISLYANKDAKTTKKNGFQLIAQASINGQTIEKVVRGNALSIIKPGDIVTTTKQSAVAIKPGGKTKLTVSIERRNGFKGRVPLEVRGLPHGVRVLDIGLNGILITEDETRRTMTLYAEPWVQATNHPIVVLARREGKNTLHAAKSVLLKVMAGE